MAMSIPSWLYYLFGGTMLAVAAYEFGLLALGVVTGRSAGRDVEISHIFMGISMAGMFVGQWAFGKNTVWEIIFGLLLIWFVAAAIQSVLQYGLHLPHALIHAVMSFAMLLMYWFPMGGSTVSGSMSMAMSMSSTEGRADPGLVALLALICAHRRSSPWPPRPRVDPISGVTPRPTLLRPPAVWHRARARPPTPPAPGRPLNGLSPLPGWSTSATRSCASVWPSCLS